MDILGMLYFIVEVSRTDDAFGDELSELSCVFMAEVLVALFPPLPVVLFQMVAGLKDKLPKGYPVKKVGSQYEYAECKVLLLLWKALLACLGGLREIPKAKALSRELAGLPPEDKSKSKLIVADGRFHQGVTDGYCQLSSRYLDQVSDFRTSLLGQYLRH